MSINRRLLAVPVLIGALAVAAALLLQSHAQASSHPLTYSHLNKIQRRLISQTLASAIGPSTTVTPNVPQEGGQGLADGAPNTKPSSFPSVGGASGSGVNYVPAASGNCSKRLGSNVKVNQNCLNITDPDLQGRAQANNETFVAEDALHPEHLVASDNNYIRGDGTCGAHFSARRGAELVRLHRPQRFHSRVRRQRASVLAGRR